MGRADQVLLFSATFPEAVMRYAKDFCPNADEIKLKRDELTVAGIQQMYMDCQGYVQNLSTLSKILFKVLRLNSSLSCVYRKAANDEKGRRQIRHAC